MIILDGIPGKLNDAQEEYLHIVNNESDRLVRLINDLLDLNKLEARSIKLLFEKTGYIEIAKMVLFNLKGFAENKGLSLDIEWYPEIEWPEEELYLYADRDRVNQILINLINNALKFTERGGVKVIIEDTGMGMPKDETDKVFGKFYQATKPRSAKSSGTGLGLAITKTLVEMHGGKI